MSARIKGLSQFVADLRAVGSSEAETTRVQSELASLKRKIARSRKSHDVGGYETKKIVAKLIHIYLLGYDVEFGHEEMLNLLRSDRYSEKMFGYLGMSLLPATQADQNIASDLSIEDLRAQNDLFTGLALNYISTLKHVDRRIVPEIYKVLVSPTSPASVTRKAALTLAHCFKADNSVIPDEWIERILAIMDSPIIGVALSALPLIQELAKVRPAQCYACYGKSIRRLKAIWDGNTVEGVVPPDYIYHDVTAPWLVVKLLQTLCLYPPPLDDEVLDESTRELVVKIVEWCGSVDHQAHNQSHQNSTNAIFMEAVRVISHLNINDINIKHQLGEIMKQLLTSKDPSCRYLALDAITVLPLLPVETVFPLIKDRDYSVRDRALDALYNTTSSETIEKVAADLLDILSVSDLGIRPKIVARLAALMERYATSATWYFDTCLTLLNLGGAYVDEEVWQRLVQVVHNNQNLQSYAANMCLKALQSSRQDGITDNTVKLCAYVIGEFGPRTGLKPLDAFVALQDQVDEAGSESYRIILAAYLKFAAAWPQLQPQIRETFIVWSESSDVEAQQRASEYASLLQHPNLLQRVTAPAPAFSSQSNGLIERLKPQHTRPPIDFQKTGKSTSSSNVPILSSNWEHGFRRMLTHDQAVLFQDALLQVGCTYEFRKSLGFVRLYLRNMSNLNTLYSFSVEIMNPMGENILSVSRKSIPAATLPPLGSTEESILCEIKHPFAVSPICRITYMSGTMGELIFRLPIVLDRFMEPSVQDLQEFLVRWDRLGGEGEFKKAFKNYSASRKRTVVEDDEVAVAAMGWGIVNGTGSENIFGGSMIHTTASGNLGCLLKLERDAGRHQYVATVRSTRRMVSVVLANNLSQVYQL